MFKTPKALRLHVGIFGRTNVGKSSFLNKIAGQDVAITSPMPGTTTDAVEKPMELLPLGPVVFLDTAGIDDRSELAAKRLEKTGKVLDRSDVVVLVTEPEVWTDFEEALCRESKTRNVPVVIVINKIDRGEPSAGYRTLCAERTPRVMACSSLGPAGADEILDLLKKYLLEVCPEDFLRPPAIAGDLLPPGGLAVLIVPIDLQAPKGRLILPQVQTIRDILDNDGVTMVVKEREYRHALDNLKRPPDLVICDSQVVLKMVAETPKEIACTTFSILFSRFKGDLIEMAKGAAKIPSLRPGDRVLVAEACSHHALEDDIGRVKIPRWLRQFTGLDLAIDVCSGRDYPGDLRQYQLILHCGSCMLTRREMLFRIAAAREAGVPMTNYGVAISVLQGVAERTLAPFPAALEAYRRTLQMMKEEVRHGS
ncbi:MAG: [FeFe] hydrogenase H-cluster maturation GTPase HydF [Candidatus Omnitrophota bacterium]|jgi:[FeFe] hydrogenase H-cluster maturation GTPase HydF